ncbi:putative RNA methyltransferase [Labrys miyagiensis]|uniref:RNA methyltransferase n=1 Tax=Labrys miyagiensis TaxID=346912 RepID=A0ABQ6CTG3_9HYPH|nr:class I SAM-dependent RNA methyltransferase [Labrys miyagiensis]GLS23420.1 putative RNA methyltransferase [Labrys miyagiensis]
MIHQTDTLVQLTIERLGHRGDGVAEGPVFVPYTLSGERIEAEVQGERGRLVALQEPSPDRIEPFCPHFTRCGGCAIQHLSEPAYHAWKRGLVVEALGQAGIDVPVEPLVDAHGRGRRRATLHARKGKVGFAEARSHELIELDACPILVPELNQGLEAVRALEKQLRGLGKPLDIVLTATLTGLDCDIRGAGRIDDKMRLKLAELAARYDLARLSNHGDVVIERRVPVVRFGSVEVSPPPGAFLQATADADRALTALVQEGLIGARRVADLFAGCGTFGLALAATCQVQAFDSDKAAIAALDGAAKRAQGLKPITATARDLFHRPLLADELKPFDAVVFDPPRAGAEAQSRRLAAAKLKRVVGVSCNPATFARDAVILIAGGYKLVKVTPVDQFRHSAHVELVGVFER